MIDVTKLPESDFERAASLLRSQGLNMPPIPASLRRRLVERGKWCFSTRLLPVSPYDLTHYVEEVRAGGIKDYALVAHAGHGVNSYAMHYFLVERRCRVFLKIGWGGIYMDEKESTALVNDCFALAGRLHRAFRKGVTSGRLSPTDRLTVVASDFDGGKWRVSRRRDETGKRERVAGSRQCRGPREALLEALDWCSAHPSDLFHRPG